MNNFEPNRGMGIMKRTSGFALLDVILAIVVFAVGMLALASLQTNLTRSSVDANTRTVATNIGEEILERLRSFRRLSTDPNGQVFAFDDIDKSFAETLLRNGADNKVTRAGLQYTIDAQVDGYQYENDQTAVRTEPDATGRPDFKLVNLTISWDSNQEFLVDESRQVSGSDVGTGSVTLTGVIPSIPSLASALVAATDEGGTGGVPVDYTPGENPDIIPLKLFDDGEEGGLKKFKESTTAQPTLVRGEHIETWFDVVTYSQSAGDAVFLRREEFAAVACTCVLNNNPAEGSRGFEPALWNGVSYTEGERVSKPIGTVPNNVTQSELCGTCCRDHHDGGGSTIEEVYNRDNAGNGLDHPHYSRKIDNRGNVTLVQAGDGDTYVEACRLVRKDGFMRVTQDADQGALIGFPRGYLEFDAGARAYSDYVVDGASDYYGANGNNQTAFLQPNPPDVSSPHEFPAREGGESGDATTLPYVTEDNQQLRARAIYTDYLTEAAQTVIDDCFPLADDGSPRTDRCVAPFASTPLEIYPFFDLQMTWLARWNLVDDNGARVGNNGVVEVSNDAIEVDPNPFDNVVPYSRGLATLVSQIQGQSKVEIASHKGNLGLTATQAIDLEDLAGSNNTQDYLYINANSGSTPIPPIGVAVSGKLSSTLANRVPPSELRVESDFALCGQTDTEWSCVVPPGGATLSVSNYYIKNPRTYVCSTMPFDRELADFNTTIFVLPTEAGIHNIWVTDDLDNCR